MLEVAAAFLALVIVGVAFLIRRRRTTADRLARTHECAEDSLETLRAWKLTVESGIAGAIADGRWVSRDVRDDWSRERPVPSQHVVALARDRNVGPEARELIAFAAQDLRATVADVNERTRAGELVARGIFLDTIEKSRSPTSRRRAVVCFDNRVQVIAAAGSGKTSVMVARAATRSCAGSFPPIGS